MDRPWIEAGLKLASVREVDTPALLVQRVACLRAGNGVTQGFLRVIAASAEFREHLRSVAGGSAVPHISAGDIREFRLNLPPNSIQRQITSVIGSLDALQEVNQRRIWLQEDLARSLYQAWFVRFHFPGYKRGKLVKSQLGSIPEGWAVRPIGEIAEAVRGRSYRRNELVESGGVPFLNLKCVARDGGFRRDGVKRYRGRYKDSQRVVSGDVLVAVTDVTQERRVVAQAFRMPQFSEEFAIPSLDLVLLKPSIPTMGPFLYAALRFSGFANEVRQFANGANVLHLAVERILEHQIISPAPEIIGRFSEITGAILAECDLLEIQNEAVTTTRDLLLPRLVTGQLDISDIDLGTLTPAEAP